MNSSKYSQFYTLMLVDVAIVLMVIGTTFIALPMLRLVFAAKWQIVTQSLLRTSTLFSTAYF